MKAVDMIDKSTETEKNEINCPNSQQNLDKNERINISTKSEEICLKNSIVLKEIKIQASHQVQGQIICFILYFYITSYNIFHRNKKHLKSLTNI